MQVLGLGWRWVEHRETHSKWIQQNQELKSCFLLLMLYCESRSSSLPHLSWQRSVSQDRILGLWKLCQGQAEYAEHTVLGHFRFQERRNHRGSYSCKPFLLYTILPSFASPHTWICPWVSLVISPMIYSMCLVLFIRWNILFQEKGFRVTDKMTMNEISPQNSVLGALQARFRKQYHWKPIEM